MVTTQIMLTQSVYKTTTIKNLNKITNFMAPLPFYPMHKL